MDSGKLTIQIDLDVQPVLDTIAKAKSLENNNDLFNGLAPIITEKKKLEDALEQVEAVERQVKQTINDRAKAIMGPDWAAIKGTNYKFTRSFTGSVYELVPILDEDTGEVIKEADPEFVKITVAPNTEAITKFREANSALPECVAINESRGESIRLTVQTND